MPSHITSPRASTLNTTRMTSLRVLSRGKLFLHMKENSSGHWETLYKCNDKKKSKKKARKGKGLLSKMWKKHQQQLNRWLYILEPYSQIMCYPLDIGLMFGEHHNIFCMNLLIIGFLTISIFILFLICCCPCTSYKICSQICSNKALSEIVAEKMKKEEEKKRKKEMKESISRIQKLKNKKRYEKIQLLL